MTRDEAKKHCVAIIDLIETDRMNASSKAGELVDRFVSLGMMKLDDPKSANGRAAEAINHYFDEGDFSRPMLASDILGFIERAGLKIVEK